MTLQILNTKQSKNLSPSQLEMIGVALNASRNLRNLVESLLEYSSVESKRFVAYAKSFDAHEIVRDVIAEAKPLADAKNLELRLVEPKSLPVINSDPKLVRVILNNLISNALKFTHQGFIEVSYGQKDGHLYFEVRDTGIGISKEEQIRIFDPFVQLEPIAQKGTSGVGLGLALVQQMVRLLNGKVMLESEPGHGSRFRVELPMNATPPVDYSTQVESPKSL